MFKFSFDWLREESEIDVSYDELIHWLDIQGFEIASIEEFEDGDKAIEIEVKANRPDMLSVAGVLREFYSGKGVAKMKDFDPGLELVTSPDPAVIGTEIKILSEDVHRYCAVEIKGVDNTGKTPEYIADRLTKMGVACINPIVDISNYVLLCIGQPIHIFDADKVRGAIRVENIADETKFVTLASSEITLPKGALLISDEENPLCVAGIIGGHAPEVDENTKNIIIESANFDHVIERITSKKSHVQTAASYRFERGVSTDTAVLGAKLSAKMILDICGGEYNKNAFLHTDGKGEEKSTLNVTKSRINALLGSELSLGEIEGYLNACWFGTECSDGENIKVTIPYHRLDCDYDVDIIEEVGRMFGYQNIVPQPVKMYAPYIENPINKNSNKLRDIMVGCGLTEILTYGFIPGDAMETLCIKEDSGYYGDVRIMNPLSSFYELMRPSLAYGLISTAINNLCVGVNDIAIFEIGKGFFRQPGFEDGYNERNVFAALITGAKHKRGFGVAKDVKYSVYDGVSLLDCIMSEYNIPYSVVNSDSLGMFEKGAGGDIIVAGKKIGVIGRISGKVLSNFENGKLARDEVVYLEFCFEGFEESKKSIKHESNFPSVEREYNFIVKHGVHFADYAPVIKNASDLIVSVKPCDVYTGQGVAQGTAAVLIRVEYNAPDRTLGFEEIEAVEARFKADLEEKFGIVLKL